MREGTIISRRLREARQRAGITQIALGVLAGMDPSVASVRVNQYERGKHTPGLNTIARLARCLSVPVPYFYAEDDQLAGWILAFNKVSPAVRRTIAGGAVRTTARLK